MMLTNNKEMTQKEAEVKFAIAELYYSVMPKKKAMQEIKAMGFNIEEETK